MANIRLQFRNADAEDAKRVQELVETAFQTEDSRPDWTGNAKLASYFKLDPNEVKKKFENPEIITLVAFDEDNGNMVGTIEVSKREGEVGRLSMVAVDDRYQRSGVGRRLLAYAEDYCRQTWGVKKFSLNALCNRKALIEWYMRQGYRKTGETEPFPKERFQQLSLPEDFYFVEMDKELADGS